MNKNAFRDKRHENICNLKSDYQHSKVKQFADVVVLEKCPDTISKIVSNILTSNIYNKYYKLGQTIDRISFQIIFTLAIIQNKYPTFVHNDFFLRNILGIDINEYDDDEYVEYKFKKNTFYFPANGFYVKNNDFGYTLAKSKMVSTQLLFINNRPDSMPKIDCNKCDIFNFFHDFYDGQNLGAKSVMKLMKRKHDKNKKYIRNIFKKYIDVAMIDKINKINRNKLNRTWAIKNIDLLKKTVNTPAHYLNSNIFNKYRKLPKNGVIIQVFG